MSYRMETLIQDLGIYNKNHLFMKREDLIPFSFGGNKARKAMLFFEDFDKGEYDCVVTYGSSSSNHCRVVANICVLRGIACYIISPEESSEKTANSKMLELFKAEILVAPVTEVAGIISKKLLELEAGGKKPYFIPGGGHGNIGTQAFIDCYEEILNNSVRFDYIFFASGTGTTQAGLIAGKLLNNGRENIIGISIARKNPRGRQIVVDSVTEYFSPGRFPYERISEETVFLDNYIGGGYAKRDKAVEETIKEVLLKYGIPMDSTYTGKAFHGMKEYIVSNRIEGKNILFIHTGGTPLFFDTLDNF